MKTIDKTVIIFTLTTIQLFAQIQLKTGVVANGGKASASGGYTLQSTAGQAVISRMTIPSGNSESGDWYQIMADYVHAPQALSIESGDDEFVLRWKQSESDDVYRYNIYYGSVSPAIDLLDSVMTPLCPMMIYTQRDTIAQQVYYYRVTAVDESRNESGYSNEVSTLDTSTAASPLFISDILAPVNPIEKNTEINFSAAFTNQSGIRTAAWDWGDDSTATGHIQEQEGCGTITGIHRYRAEGVYQVKLNLTDNSNHVNVSIFNYIVVFDPETEFMAGSGWMNSPECAYVPDSTIFGTAYFGFVINSMTDPSLPDSNSQFCFKVADLEFVSTEFLWQDIEGPHVKCKGFGRINNGEGIYEFMLAIIDGDIYEDRVIDKLRLQIWQKDKTETAIYDNQMGNPDTTTVTDAIEGGCIVMHMDLADLEYWDENAPLIPNVFVLHQNFPNPFNPETKIRFQLPRPEHVKLRIFNISGQKVKTIVDDIYRAGYHSVIWDGKSTNANQVSNGIYMYQIIAGEFRDVKKMVVIR